MGPLTNITSGAGDAATSSNDAVDADATELCTLLHCTEMLTHSQGWPLFYAGVAVKSSPIGLGTVVIGIRRELAKRAGALLARLCAARRPEDEM